MPSKPPSGDPLATAFPALERGDGLQTLFPSSDDSAPSGEYHRRESVDDFLAQVARNTSATSSGRVDASTERFGKAQAIGEGAFGTVHRVFDHQRGEDVAVKMLTRMDPQALYLFKREFRSLADIQHRNLVALHELIAVDGRWAMVLGYVPGENFDRFARQGSAVDYDRVRKGLVQLADGVRALHHKGKLHRDIKPSNVRVTPEGQVVLLDFGLVTDLQSEVTAAQGEGVVGTLAYMSPEQANGERVSQACDWYAVGVMLYEILAGKRPFEGTSLQVLKEKQERDPPPPSSLVPGIPSDLDAVCMALLRRDPKDRGDRRTILNLLQGITRRGTSVGPELGKSSFVGRTDELHDLRRACREPPAVVFVQGAAGMGKSELCQHFLNDLGDDTIVVAGRCFERESVPYKALDGMIDALSQVLSRLNRAEVEALLPRDVGALAQLFPVLKRIPAIADARTRGRSLADRKRRASVALGELLGRMSVHHRVIVWIDDLQWGDLDSVEILADLMALADVPPIVLIVSYRGGNPDSPAEHLRREIDALHQGPKATDLEVGPLSTEDAIALAEGIVGGNLEGLMPTQVIEDTGGNPLFVYATTRVVMSLGTRPGTSTEPMTLVSITDALLDNLDYDERSLLEVIALAGGPIEIAIAEEAAEVQNRQAVQTLRAERMIRDSSEPGTVECFHHYLRDQVVQTIGPGRRAEHHRQLAFALQRHGSSDLEALFDHCRRAGLDDQARAYVIKAARQAADALAFGRAAELYRAGLELGADLDGIQLELADALASAGRLREAAAALRSFEPQVPADQRPQVQSRIARYLLVSGHLSEGERRLQQALGGLGMRFVRGKWATLVWIAALRLMVRLKGRGRQEPRAAAAVPARVWHRAEVCRSAVIGYAFLDPYRGLEFQARAMLQALRSGEAAQLTEAWSIESTILASAGAAHKRIEMALEKAAHYAELTDNPGLHRAQLIWARGQIAFERGDWRQAYDLLQESGGHLVEAKRGATLAREIDIWRRYFMSQCQLFMGDFHALASSLPNLAREARDRGDLRGIVWTGYIGAQGMLVAHRADEAKALLDSLARQLPVGRFTIIHLMARATTCDVNLYRGDILGAKDLAATLWRDMRRMRMHWSPVLRVHVRYLLARIALSRLARLDSVGMRRRTLARAQGLAHKLEHDSAPHAKGLALLLTGMTASADGDRSQAALRLQQAHFELRRNDLQLHAQVAAYRWAQHLDESSQRALMSRTHEALGKLGVANPGAIVQLLAPSALGY